MFRDPDLFARAGDRFALDGMRVEVLRTRHGAPEALRFVFDRSVDDPSYVFLVATQTGFEKPALPRSGRRCACRAPAYPTGSRCNAGATPPLRPVPTA